MNSGLEDNENTFLVLSKSQLTFCRVNYIVKSSKELHLNALHTKILKSWDIWESQLRPI